MHMHAGRVHAGVVCQQLMVCEIGTDAHAVLLCKHCAISMPKCSGTSRFTATLLCVTFAATEAEEAAKSKNFDSWNTSPTCKYRKSVDNFNLDTLGRPWGFDIATKQSCTFQDISAPQISWEDAKDCTYKLTDSNALPDSQGRLWGFDAVAMQGCAFKSQSLPAGRFEAGDMTPGTDVGQGTGQSNAWHRWLLFWGVLCRQCRSAWVCFQGMKRH